MRALEKSFTERVWRQKTNWVDYNISMLFNSLQFLVFFPGVTVLYFLFPHRFRWALLLIASCVFYMAFIPMYILILATTIVVDYFAGLQIEKSEGGRRKFFFILSIVSNVGFLAFFKYANFIDTNIATLAQLLHWNYGFHALKIALPIGLSFHTFQAMSYIIEVYRGKQKAERHFGIYALYVMFFPQLVAGPIERPQNLIHQFYETHVVDWVRIGDGLRLMLWGFFKKVVVADTLAQGVNVIYNHPGDFTGTSYIVATIFFAFQVYCDFSGYSDIARGAARVLGFRLMLNFNAPYHAWSLSEFWKRWHISLSSWIRDYIFMPLAVRWRRWGIWGVGASILVAFFLSGLWHGANWTFVIWGILNGAMLSFELLAGTMRKNASRLLPEWLSLSVGRAYVFLFWCFTLVFFRAHEVDNAFHIITNLFSDLSLGNYSVTLTKGYMWFVYALAGIILMEAVELLREKSRVVDLFTGRPIWAQWLAYAILVLIIVFSGNPGGSEFIYFQF